MQKHLDQVKKELKICGYSSKTQEHQESIMKKGKSTFGQNKVRANIFSGSLAIFRNERSAHRRRASRRLARGVFSRR